MHGAFSQEWAVDVRRTEVRNIREQFEKLIADASIVRYCFICGGVHDIEECPMQDDENILEDGLQCRSPRMVLLLLDHRSRT